jgi:hypothetical protein
MNWPLGDGLLLIEGARSFLLVGRAMDDFPLYIESCTDEFCEGIRPDDLVAVSAPEGGPHEPAAMLLDLVRLYHMPLVVLPKRHPGSKRLKLVVAVSDAIETNCGIQRGTHPEQHLLCSSDELAGIQMKGAPGVVEMSGVPPTVSIRYLRSPSGQS